MIFKSINRSQALVEKLARNTGSVESSHLLTSLTAELEIISKLAQQLSENKLSNSVNSKPEMKSGCYVFANEKGFFCPNCYDNTGYKIPTKRLSSKLRVCTSCRTSIQ